LTISHPMMKDNSGIRHIRYLNILSKVATDTITTPNNNAKLAACVVYKNNLISFGVNERKTHPFQAKYRKNKDSVFLHAETAAIKNALKHLNVEELSKSTLYVCRVKFLNEERQKLIFGLAKPCSGCFHCINIFGIRKVIFSLDNGSYGML